MSGFTVAVLGILLRPMVALAETGTPPADGTATVDAGPPWGLILAAGSIALIAIAIKLPGSRRWIAACVILVGGALAALTVLFIGTLGGWSGRPDEPWTIPGAIGVALIGVLLGVAVIRRGGPARPSR